MAVFVGKLPLSSIIQFITAWGPGIAIVLFGIVGLILLCGGLAGALYCLYTCRTCLATLWVNRPKVYFAPREGKPAKTAETKTEEYEMRILPPRRVEDEQPIYQRTRHIKNQVDKH